MSTEENKAVMRRFYEEVFNKKNIALLGEFVAPNAIDHAVPPELPAGIEGSRQFISMYLTAFPDLHLTVEDQIAEGDKVVTRLSTSGTHQGPLMGVPPTGKQAMITVLDIDQIVGGKIVEHWLSMDTFGLLQQLGAIPAPEQARQ